MNPTKSIYPIYKSEQDLFTHKDKIKSIIVNNKGKQLNQQDLNYIKGSFGRFDLTNLIDFTSVEVKQSSKTYKKTNETAQNGYGLYDRNNVNLNWTDMLFGHFFMDLRYTGEQSKIYNKGKAYNNLLKSILSKATFEDKYKLRENLIKHYQLENSPIEWQLDHIIFSNQQLFDCFIVSNNINILEVEYCVTVNQYIDKYTNQVNKVLQYDIKDNKMKEEFRLFHNKYALFRLITEYDNKALKGKPNPVLSLIELKDKHNMFKTRYKRIYAEDN